MIGSIPFCFVHIVLKTIGVLSLILFVQRHILLGCPDLSVGKLAGSVIFLNFKTCFAEVGSEKFCSIFQGHGLTTFSCWEMS